MAGEALITAGTRPGKPCRNNSALSERGVTLIETMLAGSILITVVIGVMPVFILGAQTTEQQGDIATRTTEYAQDKMESLLKLDFNDAATDTTAFPPNAAGGSGLGGTMDSNSSVGGGPPEDQHRSRQFFASGWCEGPCSLCGAGFYKVERIVGRLRKVADMFAHSNDYAQFCGRNPWAPAQMRFAVNKRPLLGTAERRPGLRTSPVACEGFSLLEMMVSMALMM